LLAGEAGTLPPANFGALESKEERAGNGTEEKVEVELIITIR
jgi:hypothetical protein